MRADWEIKILGEVYDVRDGTHDSPKYQESGFPLITSKNLKDGSINYDNVKYISKIDYENINKRSKVDIGDVLFAMIGTIGNPVVVTNVPDYAIKNVALFKIDRTRNSKFLKYYLESEFVVDKMNKEAKGTTQKFVGLGYLRKFPIPIPPLPEQKQIVAILDKAFAAIDQAKANIEKNIENAKELFQSKLNQIFSQKGEGWEEMKLKDVCEIKPNKGETNKILKPDDEVSFVPMKYLGENSLFFNSPEIKKYKDVYSGYVYFKEDDVVLAKITPCFENGKLGIAKGLKNGVGFGSSEYIPFRVDKTKLLNEYLYFFLNRDFFRKKGEKLMSGAVGHKRVQPSFYEEELIPIPSLTKQIELCRNIKQIQIILHDLEKYYRKKLTNLEEFKKSILQKAFAGELTKKQLSV